MDKNKEIQAELNEDNLIKLNHKRIGVLKKLFQKVIDGTVTVVSHAPGAKFFVPKILDKINEREMQTVEPEKALDPQIPNGTLTPEPVKTVEPVTIVEESKKVAEPTVAPTIFGSPAPVEMEPVAVTAVPESTQEPEVEKKTIQTIFPKKIFASNQSTEVIPTVEPKVKKDESIVVPTSTPIDLDINIPSLNNGYAEDAVKEEALRAGQYYVNHRWLGGTLTNFKTIKNSINKLQNLYKMEEEGKFEVLPKKEVIMLKHERERLEKFLSGIKDMKKVPEALFIVDPRKEENAILEARKLNIPVFGIVDTNCDPDLVDYVIPANDDAIRAVKLIAGVMANAVIEANGGVVEKFTEDEVVNLNEEIEKEDEAKASDKAKDKRPRKAKKTTENKGE